MRADLGQIWSDPVGQSEDAFTIHEFFIEPRGFILIRWWLHKQLRLNMIMASNFSAGVLDGLLLGVKLLAWQQIQFCGFAYAALIHWGYISNLCEFPKGAKQDLTWCTVSAELFSVKQMYPWTSSVLSTLYVLEVFWTFSNIFKLYLFQFWKQLYFPILNNWQALEIRQLRKSSLQVGVGVWNLLAVPSHQRIGIMRSKSEMIS